MSETRASAWDEAAPSDELPPEPLYPVPTSGEAFAARTRADDALRHEVQAARRHLTVIGRRAAKAVAEIPVFIAASAPAGLAFRCVVYADLPPHSWPAATRAGLLGALPPHVSNPTNAALGYRALFAPAHPLRARLTRTQWVERPGLHAVLWHDATPARHVHTLGAMRTAAFDLQTRALAATLDADQRRVLTTSWTNAVCSLENTPPHHSPSPGSSSPA